MRALPAVALLVVSAAAAQETRDYVVLAAFDANDPFDAAAQVLVKARSAQLVRFAPDDLEPVKKALAAAMPRHVALVMRPEQIEFAFARRFLQLATELDEDPFVDFAFGYITGRTADDAAALSKRGVARKPRAVRGEIAMVAGGCEQSMVTSHPHLLRKDWLAARQIFCATGDRDFVKKHLPSLADCDAVTFAGHGYPREVVGGPTFAELAGLDLGDAVVLNVACYTGVTHRWFEDDYQAAVMRQREVPLDESFGLSVLHAGAVGYTAYVCPRPAGPELDTDLAALIADGCSLGDARRRDYDKTVLGFLGFGEERLQLEPVADGAKFSRQREPVRDMMLEGATGGVLFGDPACVPFVAKKDESPVALTFDSRDGAIVVRAKASVTALYLQCSDPTAEWGKTMAMKVHARVPLGDRHVTDVVVEELRIGRDAQPSRVLWAIEDDHGKRFVQLRVNFPRGEQMNGALVMTARVLTTKDAELGKLRGGEVPRLRPRSKDVQSRVIQPFMLDAAKAREVSKEALQAALDASAQLLGDGTVDAAARSRFAALRSEGFRAVCALLEVGHSHYRTWQLLQATWQPGDERHLLALAAIPDLPNYAGWQVLEGLGVADTPAVRKYLLQRLTDEQDAGMFMAAAKGLVHLGAREAAAAIGDRVLEYRERWGGAEQHLVDALAELGGAHAIERLEKIAASERTADRPAAAKALQRARKAGGASR